MKATLMPQVAQDASTQGQDEPKMDPRKNDLSSWQRCWPQDGAHDLQDAFQDHNQTSNEPTYHDHFKPPASKMNEKPKVFGMWQSYHK